MTSPSPPSSISRLEASSYYAGLPSRPRLLARTSTTLWRIPTGPEAYTVLHELRAIFNHKLNDIWEDNVAPVVIACLDEMRVKWTSLDIVHIGKVGSSNFPVILWIGIKPRSLTGEDAKNAAFRCRNVLEQFDITDVEVELRESSIIRSAGPKLLPPIYDFDPTFDVRHPLTHALGLPISAQDTPLVGGTGGFFMAESSNSNKLLLITARHVVLPPDKSPNDKFKRRDESEHRFNVLLMGDKAQRWIMEVEGQDNELTKAKKAVQALNTFLNDVEKNWNPITNRILGHLVCSPPIRLGVGTIEEQYTEDFAIIAVDDDKIDRTKFKGNSINLVSDIRKFISKMNPSRQKPSTFEYPYDRLLELQGLIPDEDLRKPTALDKNNECCLLVIKSGGITGRANGSMSYVRDDDSHGTSKEWAIMPYDDKSFGFSAPGDSGAIVVDGQGRMGGLLTSGSGCETFTDISYATPISCLLKSIRANGYPDAHFNLA